MKGSIYQRLHYRHFSKINLKTHSGFLREMISRDKNHPSVIAWSLANEPQTYQAASADYFKTLYDIAKSLETSWRPITAVYGPTNSGNDVTVNFLQSFLISCYSGAPHGYLIRKSILWVVY